jgi:hypothetical protein
MPSPLKTRLLVVVCLLASLLSLPQQLRGESQPPLISFQVPDSRATYPLSINEARTITGYYISNSDVTGGFVRYEDGHIITFNVPGSLATIPVSINVAGDITGYYNLPSTTPIVFDIPQGFVRSPDGKITIFGNYVGTVSFASFWPQPVGINAAGEIVGNYPDFSLASVVFLRSAVGVVLTFSLSLGSLYSTVATGLNASGAIVGYASSQSLSLAEGFLWEGQGPIPNPGGGFTPITVSGSTGTFPTGINAHGTIVGCYAAGGLYQDFVRNRDSVVTTLDIPGTVPDCIATFTPGFIAVAPQSVIVNDQGTIAGYSTEAAQIASGFIRLEDGKVTTFNYPGSKQTIPTSINNCDVITGYYSRGQEILGFIREP